MNDEDISNEDMRGIGAAVITAIIQMKVSGYSEDVPTLLSEAIEHLTNGDMATAADCFEELSDKLRG